METIKTTKRTSGIITVFYLLIVFEFIYMASPFALYFYSVYKPGLSVLNHFPGISWLTGFFLPHIVEETKSPIINMLGLVGGLFFGLGLLMFVICAIQVYYNKLFRKGAVTGGLYKIIRHPQYTGFALSGFGMLLIWPRFLILITFVTILFVYYFLARIEEKECETKYGDSYTAYKRSTYMFLPFRIPFLSIISLGKPAKQYKTLIFITSYLSAIIISVLLANGIRKFSIGTLYTTYQEKTVNLSITKLSDYQIDDLLRIAMSNQKVDSLIKPLIGQPDLYFLNYILPSDIYYISEIPMHIPDSMNCSYGQLYQEENIYKVIIAKAIPGSKKQLKAKEILLFTRFTEAIAEVWIDMNSGNIARVLLPATKKRYENIPVPIF